MWKPWRRRVLKMRTRAGLPSSPCTDKLMMLFAGLGYTLKVEGASIPSSATNSSTISVPPGRGALQGVRFCAQYSVYSLDSIVPTTIITTVSCFPRTPYILAIENITSWKKECFIKKELQYTFTTPSIEVRLFSFSTIL